MLTHNRPRLKPCQSYSHNITEWEYPLTEPGFFRVNGTLHGDINWNNISANIEIKIPNNRIAECRVEPFTNNCGIKTIQNIRNFQQSSFYLKYVESFLYYCCNCSIIVGSDWISKIDEGCTGKAMKQNNYIITKPVWNQNYYYTPDHQIFLFYKYLNEESGLVNYWS